MTAHVFGNSPSPAVAIYCLRKCVESVKPGDRYVQDFVRRDFYVDNGLKSTSSVRKADSLVKRTRGILMNKGQFRLHKTVK